MYERVTQMTKVALLVPYESILQAAEKVIDERHYKINYKKVIRTEDSVNEARMAIKAGARIIIARGLQAKLIKEYTNIPLVEMRFHSQEIGLLLKRAKAILAKENPVIGLIVFSNMLCNMTHMEERFDVKCIEENCRKYNKHLKLTKGGKEKLLNLPWEGNAIQIQSFCERLVLDTEKRNISETEIQKLYSNLYPLVRKVKGEDKVVVYSSEEAAQLAALLKKHNGSRSLVAQELGISTTTLWRKMKKFGIEANYEGK